MPSPKSTFSNPITKRTRLLPLTSLLPDNHIVSISMKFLASGSSDLGIVTVDSAEVDGVLDERSEVVAVGSYLAVALQSLFGQ